MTVKVNVIDEKGIDSKAKAELKIEGVETADINLHEFDRYQKNRHRISSACTKTRGEIARSKKKLYKQKGTGNARRGSASSPLLKGGAVAFGPTGERAFAFKLNRKFINKMIKYLFQNKDEIFVLSETFNLAKTKEANALLNKLKIDGDKKVLLLSTVNDDNQVKPFANIDRVIIDDATFFSPEKFVTSHVIITSNGFKYIEGVINDK